jgi:hypothetical protein
MRTGRKQALLEYGLGIPIAGFFYIIIDMMNNIRNQMLLQGCSGVPDEVTGNPDVIP